MNKNVGILGIGTYLPPEVRTNDWWPKEVVARWSEKAVRGEARAQSENVTEEERAILRAQAESQNDPFRGARERRVMPEGMLSVDMEVAAAEDALSRCNVAPAEIDLLLVQSAIPDYLDTNSAALVHHRLGLKSECYSLLVEAVCNSFQMQLALAIAMIRAGSASKALLVQSCAISRVLPYDEAYSTAFGDAATAVVVGEVEPGFGVLSQHHRTDGSFDGALVTGQADGWWWESGRSVLYSRERAAAFRMLLEARDMARTVALPALAAAGLTPSDVNFYAGHQATCWFRAVTQAGLGLENARALDTFPWAGSVFGANLPLVLASAMRENMLSRGDVVLMFSGGSGVSVSGTVLRWST